MKRIWFPVFALLGIVAIAAALGERRFTASVPAIFGTGPNAVWLRHSWVGEKHSPEEYKQLAGLLMQMGMTDAYVHAGPLEWEGTVNPERIKNAGEFIARLKLLCPRLRLQAYLGQVEAGGGGPLDLSSPTVRSAVIQTAAGFLDLGFDGIHYDIEPIRNNNAHFLDLLERTRRITRPRGAVLSVAACRPEPFPGVSRLTHLICRHPGFWTRKYFLEVSRRADQTAVMVYDSALPLPALYGSMVSWIVRWCDSQNVGEILIGVPTYDKSPSHNPRVESPGNTLIGLKRGLSAITPSRRGKFGAAVFAEWTTSETEWDVIRRLWASPKASKDTNDR